jgi:hypothetical protein
MARKLEAARAEAEPGAEIEHVGGSEQVSG